MSVKYYIVSALMSALIMVQPVSMQAAIDNCSPPKLPIADPNDFRFAVIGDRQGQERIGVFETVVKKINLLNPEFVVSVGDSIEGYTEDVNSINKQWDEFDASIRQLRMPFLKTVGNHDMTNETLARIYKQRYGRPYFHIVYKNTLFLFVNTEDPVSKEPDETRCKLDKIRNGNYVENEQDAKLISLKKKLNDGGYTDTTGVDDYEQKNRDFRNTQITDEQVGCFEDVLAQNHNVRWTFIIMHKHAYQETNPQKNWLKLEKMFSDRPHTIFSGHEHRYKYRVRDGYDYIGLATAGAGRKYPPDAQKGVYDSILWVTMNDKGPVIANILVDGIFDKTDVRKAKVLSDAEMESLYRGGNDN